MSEATRVINNFVNVNGTLTEVYGLISGADGDTWTHGLRTVFMYDTNGVAAGVGLRITGDAGVATIAGAAFTSLKVRAVGFP